LTRLRDGDPQALAAVCERRGGAVYAYCSYVAGDGLAIEAAAAAFADFRLAVRAASNLTEAELDALLREKTRRAAARRGINVVASRAEPRRATACDGQEIRLVRYAENSLAPEVRKVFAEHVASCRPCTEALVRLQAGERALERAPRAPLPLRVTDEILMAMALAAPVRAWGGDPVLVHREALRLLTRDVDPAPAPVAPKRPTPHIPPDPIRRPRRRRRRDATATRSTRLATWGTILAGAVGTAFGLGLVILTDDQPVSSRPATAIAGLDAGAVSRTVQPPSAATSSTGGSAEKLHIEAIATTVHALRDAAGPAARVSVRVRITNATGRLARARRPVLYVGDARVELATVSATTATSPIASLAAGSVAEGRLGFRAEGAAAQQLTAARVRLRISGQSVPLTPLPGDPTAPS
jgi:hypothetical protein